VGNEKLRILGPPIAALGKADFLIAQRLTMGFGRVLFMWGAVADVGVQDDEGRPALGLLEDFQRLLDTIDVVGVPRPQNVPPITEESRGDVFRERDPRV